MEIVNVQLSRLCAVIALAAFHLASACSMSGWGKPWTPAEISYLQRHFHRTTLTFLVQELGRSPSDVWQKLTELGLHIHQMPAATVVDPGKVAPLQGPRDWYTGEHEVTDGAIVTFTALARLNKLA